MTTRPYTRPYTRRKCDRKHHGLTNRRTDRRKDTRSYRVASLRLETDRCTKRLSGGQWSALRLLGMIVLQSLYMSWYVYLLWITSHILLSCEKYSQNLFHFFTLLVALHSSSLLPSRPSFLLVPPYPFSFLVQHCLNHLEPVNGHFSLIWTKALPTDRPTDGPMDGRTRPLIEMRGRI